jgi:hypothetical protein
MSYTGYLLIQKLLFAADLANSIDSYRNLLEQIKSCSCNTPLYILTLEKILQLGPIIQVEEQEWISLTDICFNQV